MAKRKSRGQSEEEIEVDAESQEEPKKRKVAKKRKAPVEKKEAAPKRVAKPGVGERPLSVGGIIIRSASSKQDWEKDAPWHRKNPAHSRFADHGTDRRTKD
jgi:hypothetical protein